MLGLGGLLILYVNMFGSEKTNILIVLNVISGFSLGASSIALFARVGGGIYTKAADVGADLVGKVEAGIPEDHPFNPATIADNVGDNVGDVAGMGADLFESYVGSIIGSMVLGASILTAGQFDINFVLLPVFIAAAGILVSIIGTFLVSVKEGGDPQKALNQGEFGSAVIMLFVMFLLINTFLPDTFTCKGNSCLQKWVFFMQQLLVLAAGLGLGIITEYYTGTGTSPVKSNNTAINYRFCYKYHRGFSGWNAIYSIPHYDYCLSNHWRISLRWFIWYSHGSSRHACEHRNTISSRCLRSNI